MFIFNYRNVNYLLILKVFNLITDKDFSFDQLKMSIPKNTILMKFHMNCSYVSLTKVQFFKKCHAKIVSIIELQQTAKCP